MELNLEDDLDDLRGLSREVIEEAPPDLANELDGAWRERDGVPEFGYSVVKGYGLDSMALWKVQFVGKSGRPAWSRGRSSKCWVRYRFVECLWKGPTHTNRTQVTGKDGRVISVFTGSIEQFDLTLIDAVSRLRGYRDLHYTEATGHLAMLRDNIRRLQAEEEKQVGYLARLNEFNPNAVVPSDLLEAEDLAIDQLLAKGGL